MPGRYYRYDEIDRSPNERWVSRELGYYSYGIYDIRFLRMKSRYFLKPRIKL